MTYAQLIKAATSGRHSLPQKAVRKALVDFWDALLCHVEEGGRVVIPAVGVFYPKRLKKRRNHNVDGTPITLPESVRLGFRASKHAKWRGR